MSSAKFFGFYAEKKAFGKKSGMQLDKDWVKPGEIFSKISFQAKNSHFWSFFRTFSWTWSTFGWVCRCWCWSFRENTISCGTRCRRTNTQQMIARSSKRFAADRVSCRKLIVSFPQAVGVVLVSQLKNFYIFYRELSLILFWKCFRPSHVSETSKLSSRDSRSSVLHDVPRNLFLLHSSSASPTNGSTKTFTWVITSSQLQLGSWLSKKRNWFEIISI